MLINRKTGWTNNVFAHGHSRGWPRGIRTYSSAG